MKSEEYIELHKEPLSRPFPRTRRLLAQAMGRTWLGLDGNALVLAVAAGAVVGVLTVGQAQTSLARGIGVAIALSSAHFVFRFAAIFRAHQERTRELRIVQAAAQLGTFSYEYATDYWHCSSVCEGILGIDATYKRDALGWWALLSQYPGQRFDLLKMVDDECSDRYEGEHMLPANGGPERWVSIRAHRMRDRSGYPQQVVGTIQDISQRRRSEQEIVRLAYHDELTGLPNSRRAFEILDCAAAATGRTGRKGVLLLLNLDRFKTINDSFGRDYGDLTIKAVAARLRAVVRKTDLVCRIGGNVFAVITEEVEETAPSAMFKANQFTENIRARLNVPFVIDGREIHVTASYGIALITDKDQKAADLLKNSEMAMYQAKRNGGDAIEFFDRTLNDEISKRLAMERDLWHDLNANALEIYYQVQVSDDGRPAGAEALLRWNHAVMGQVSPSVFIPIAENSSLILELGKWVLKTACEQLAVWAQSEHMRHLTLAINVSSVQFIQDDFISHVALHLRENNFPSSRLKLELTESVMVNDVTKLIRTMRTLKAMGVTISMDDFGTGYSSLSSLKVLPVDQVKIDQSFVRDLELDRNSETMVKTIIDLANNFGLEVIAEGVENEAQIEILRAYGCIFFQGYYFGRPMPLKQFEALVEQQAEQFTAAS